MRHILDRIRVCGIGDILADPERAKTNFGAYIVVSGALTLEQEIQINAIAPSCYHSQAFLPKDALLLQSDVDVISALTDPEVWGNSPNAEQQIEDVYTKAQLREMDATLIMTDTYNARVGMHDKLLGVIDTSGERRGPAIVFSALLLNGLEEAKKPHDEILVDCLTLMHKAYPKATLLSDEVLPVLCNYFCEDDAERKFFLNTLHTWGNCVRYRKFEEHSKSFTDICADTPDRVPSLLLDKVPLDFSATTRDRAALVATVYAANHWRFDMPPMRPDPSRDTAVRALVQRGCQVELPAAAQTVPVRALRVG